MYSDIYAMPSIPNIEYIFMSRIDIVVTVEDLQSNMDNSLDKDHTFPWNSQYILLYDIEKDCLFSNVHMHLFFPRFLQNR